MRSDAEIFSKFARGSLTAHEVVRRTYYADTGHKYVGSKVMLPQVTEEDLNSVLAIKDIRVIVLERKNLLRQYLSLKIAHKDKLFSQPTESQRSAIDERKVHIELDELLEYRNLRHSWYGKLEAKLENRSRLHVTYEDMEADLNREIQRVADFLGLGQPERVEPPRLLRQNPEPLRELISNFDELRTALLDRQEFELLGFSDS